MVSTYKESESSPFFSTERTGRVVCVVFFLSLFSAFMVVVVLSFFLKN